MGNSKAYKDAGVDLSAAEQAKKKIARLAKETFTPNVVGDIGAFGGIYRFPTSTGNLLLASCDGVGTKIKVATAAGIYNTVGQDLVNHCVNDILTLGAEPLFFLDYIGHSDLTPDKIAEIVEGLSIACRQNGFALIGGETAQMPGLYSYGDFDLVGFIVGSAAEDNLIDGNLVRPGDRLIAISSNGLQTNGYSLARKLLLDSGRFGLDDRPEILAGQSVGEALLAIHPSYLMPIAALMTTEIKIHAMAHITGGGIEGNLIRVLPERCVARVVLSDVSAPSVFELIASEGKIPKTEMCSVFNMGVGFIVIVGREFESDAVAVLKDAGADAVPCGEIAEGEKSVLLSL